MAAWCFDKKDISNSPSFQMGVEPDVEARYRREGARFINNVGQKLGLRFDTCATGVTYFHRFYMFHSFKEFNRYVIGTACLFLAGKVEETPKKCRDLIKAAQSFLSEQQLATFGEDPKEEVMTMERILLQTIKFDLQVEHPYTYLLKYAKTFKGDKAKIQKVVQMAWAFSNDSLCTTLCLQWEPEIIAIALIHLACRLTKFEIQDWQGKLPSQKGKWWDQFVEDISLKLLEDICHQVLDLYSQVQNKEVASPTAAAVGSHGSGGGESSTSRRASMGGSSSNASSTPASPAVKVQSKAYEAVAVGGGSLPEPLQSSSGTTPASSSATVVGSAAAAAIAAGAALPQLTGQLSVSGGAAAAAVTTYAGHYIPQQLYTSSFLSSEGTQSLASLIGSQQLPFGGAPLPPSPLPPHPMSQPFPGAPYPGNGGPFGGPQQYYPGPPLPGSSFGAASPHPPLPPTPGPAAGPGGFPAFAGLIGGAPPYPGMPHGYGFPGPVPSDYHPPLPPPHHHPGVNLGRGGSHRGNHRGGGNVGGGGAGGGGGEGSQQHDGKSNKQNLSLRSSLVQIV